VSAAAATAMAWHGELALDYRAASGRTIVRDRHTGPLRVLRALHPEGGICHSVLVHPPGGIVGGDVLAIKATLGEGAHALVTTPGATRFYRSAGAAASQSLEVVAEAGARLEWLPLETIAYSGCEATNRIRFVLAAGAETIGWDITALGLPESSLPFVAGRFAQSIEIPGCWLERATIAADDRLLLDSPLGWAGRRVLATMWFARGDALAVSRRDALLAAARDVARAHPLHATAGATAPHDDVVVVRALAERVEPAMALLRAIWQAWRRLAWRLDAIPPRVWAT